MYTWPLVCCYNHCFDDGEKQRCSGLRDLDPFLKVMWIHSIVSMSFQGYTVYVFLWIPLICPYSAIDQCMYSALEMSLIV